MFLYINDIYEMNQLYSILNMPINDSNDVSFASYTGQSTLSPVSVEDEYKISLETEAIRPLKMKKNKVQFANMNDSMVAYEAHPSILTQNNKKQNNKKQNNKKQNTKEEEEDSDTESDMKWATSMQLYLGSITVIGLYALFRALQRSR